MSAEEFLREAITQINKPQKWTKGNYSSIDGVRHCILGAMGENENDAQQTIVEFINAKAAVSRVIQEEFPERWTTDPGVMPNMIPGFNDHKNTTHKDVMMVMEKAAIQLGEQGK